MIVEVCNDLKSVLLSLGWAYDESESDSLASHHYTLRLPDVVRDTVVRTFAHAGVIRHVNIRLQFVGGVSSTLHLQAHAAVESVVVALRGRAIPYLFSAARIEERKGGIVMDIAFDVRDSMN